MTTFTKIAKTATSFAKGAKSAVEYVKEGLSSFLLRQDGSYLLLEGGGRIVISATAGGKEVPVYTKQPK